MQRLLQALKVTPNKGRAHVFLGPPLGDAADKTVVEPGNGFSPGIWTCGISVWVEVDGQLVSPDQLDDIAIEFAFDGGDDPRFAKPPVVRSTYRVSPTLIVDSRLAHLNEAEVGGADIVEVGLVADRPQTVRVYVVVRDVGPAGGAIADVTWHPDTQYLSISPANRIAEPYRLSPETPPLQVEILPPGMDSADGTGDSPLAILVFDVHTAPGNLGRVGFKVRHPRPLFNPDGSRRVEGPPPAHRMDVAEALERCRQAWFRANSARVYASDPRIEAAWQKNLFHVINAMECGLPRISPVDYPVFWLRGCTSIIRALDITGRHDLAHAGCNYLSSILFASPFGAEADAPGLGIWALVSHGLITQDLKWLNRQFSAIGMRVRWIERMLEARRPVRAVGDNRVPGFFPQSDANVVCWPSRRGLVRGRVAGQSPTFYVNAWCIAGFLYAAKAAMAMEKLGLAEGWRRQAWHMELAMAEHGLHEFQDDLDAMCAPHPTEVLYSHRFELRERFEAFFRGKRLDEDANRVGEPFYPYVEIAQAHNAMLLGLGDLAWKCLDGVLDSQDAPGLPWHTGAFVEGMPGGFERLPFRNDLDARGWLNPDSAIGANMPNAWAAAELLCCLRSIFVVEDGDRLILGAGVPDSWLKPGSHFGVENLSTNLGRVSYHVRVKDDGQLDISYHGPEQRQVCLQSPVQKANEPTVIITDSSGVQAGNEATPINVLTAAQTPAHQVASEPPALPDEPNAEPTASAT